MRSCAFAARGIAPFGGSARASRLAIAGLTVALALAACGGASAATPSGAALPTAVVATLPPLAAAPAIATPAAVGTAAPVATPAAGATAPAAATPSSTATVASGPPALGKQVYETAGEVGCQDCHGPTAKGGQTKGGQGAPDIRGAPEAKVRDALRGGVPLMSFIKLKDEELKAVVEYLRFLNEQP